MPTLSIEIPQEVADALNRQARAMLLGRRQYVRALLAAVASHAEDRPVQSVEPVSQEQAALAAAE